MIPTKICGITHLEDAQCAVNNGASAIGFIFYEKSPRCISIEKAKSISHQLSIEIAKVGVFVNHDKSFIDDAIQSVPLDMIQLHGNESQEFCNQFNVPVIKAFRIKDEIDMVAMNNYEVDAFLLDTFSKDAYGGTGETFDWSLLKGQFDTPIILSGGLNLDNILDAIETVNPAAVDVNSGVESSPGIKDHEKIERLFYYLKDTCSSVNVFTNTQTRDNLKMFKNYNLPDERGHFEKFGGKYVPETLIPALEELEQHYTKAKDDPSFQSKLGGLLKHYSGRETALYFAERISAELGFNVWLKREDLNHTGAHKINNALGQILLANRMGKKRIIAETGAGQHGVATATVAARFGLECIVYMGEEDIRRQKLNVFRMNLLGAEVRPVSSGSMTLKDATNEAIRDWVTNVESTYYLIGSTVGPHPYPMLVRDFQSVIGKEAKQQFMNQSGKEIPDRLVACVGGGSNAMGLFYPFLKDDVKIIGVEAAGKGLDSGEHAATLIKGDFGVLHGAASTLLQNEDGQVTLPHSISAGLDYPGIGPEHSFLNESGRVEYHSATDQEALDTFQWLSEKEGILPALESAHALTYLRQDDNGIDPGEDVVVCLSGRGDKDVHTVAEALGIDL